MSAFFEMSRDDAERLYSTLYSAAEIPQGIRNLDGTRIGLDDGRIWNLREYIDNGRLHALKRVWEKRLREDQLQSNATGCLQLFSYVGILIPGIFLYDHTFWLILSVVAWIGMAIFLNDRLKGVVRRQAALIADTKDVLRAVETLLQPPVWPPHKAT